VRLRADPVAAVGNAATVAFWKCKLDRARPAARREMNRDGLNDFALLWLDKICERKHREITGHERYVP
jgi:hypothetical protein